MMFILYLPVIMPNGNLRLPENLKWTEELFSNIDYDWNMLDRNISRNHPSVNVS